MQSITRPTPAPPLRGGWAYLFWPTVTILILLNLWAFGCEIQFLLQRIAGVMESALILAGGLVSLAVCVRVAGQMGRGEFNPRQILRLLGGGLLANIIIAISASLFAN